MSSDDSERPAYVVPSYRAPGDTAFYHFLHGTVPGHQIDFMYRPEVPQGALAQTHFGHLSRLIKYIEPRGGASHAFALGNLSRDDVQHEPGHGGVAILFALRVPGVTDHAGRDMPPYAHGIVAVDRSLEYISLLEAISVLYRRFLEREGAEDRRGDFYRAYVRAMQERPEEVETFLEQAIAEFDDIPRPRKSALGWDFIADEATPPKRIAIVHDDDEGFATLAHWAAVLGSILYRSNIKWTSITSGREIDIPGGTTIRFVPKSEAPADARGTSYLIDDLPEEEDELVALLFGAKRRVEKVVAPRQGWREKMAAQRPAASRSEVADGSQDSGDSAIEVDIDDAAATLPVASLELAAAFEAKAPGPSAAPAPPGRPSAVAASSPASAVAVPQAPPPLPAMAEPPFPGREQRASRGKWIIALAAFAAVAVIVLVAVVAGMGLQEPAQPGSGDATAPLSASAANTAAPLPAPAGPAASSATPATVPPSDSSSPAVSASQAASSPVIKTPIKKGKPPSVFGGKPKF